MVAIPVTHNERDDRVEWPSAPPNEGPLELAPKHRQVDDVSCPVLGRASVRGKGVG